jgi:hypothetical protein
MLIVIVDRQKNSFKITEALPPCGVWRFPLPGGVGVGYSFAYADIVYV